MSVSLKEELGCVSDVQIERVLRKVLSEQVVLVGSATWDVGSLASNTMESKNITVTGAALGDFAIASLGIDNVDLTVTAAVTATDTVTVTVANVGAANPTNLASTTCYVRVFPQAKYILA